MNIKATWLLFKEVVSKFLGKKEEPDFKAIVKNKSKFKWTVQWILNHMSPFIRYYFPKNVAAVKEV